MYICIYIYIYIYICIKVKMLTTVTYCQKQKFFCMTIHVLQIAFLKIWPENFVTHKQLPSSFCGLLDNLLNKFSHPVY